MMLTKKFNPLRLTLAWASSLALAITSAHADITYIDAVEGEFGNTYAKGGSQSDTSWVGTNTATQWNLRTDVEGDGDTLFQASSSTTPPPELITEITGLADGTYTIWAFYWDQIDNLTQNWVLSGGLGSGGLNNYSSPDEPVVTGATTTNVINASGLNFTTTVEVVAGGGLRNLFGVKLGEVEVSGGSAINVLIGSNINTGGNNRVWYDGVGFELSPPELVAMEITYVDAVEGSSGNTYATGGALADTSWAGPDSTALSATLWPKREEVEGNGDTLFQAASATTSVPELTTELTGLADGSYTIWAFYWDQVVDDAGNNWVLSAGLSSGSLTTYSSPGEPGVSGAFPSEVTNAGDLNFTSGVDVTAGEGLRHMFGVKLGIVKVSGGSTVNVFVGNNITNGTPNRAWYDGVGYQLMPEITYVDAVEGSSGNTYATGSSLADVSWVGPDSSSSSAMQWNKRLESAGNEGTLFQASSGTTPPPELTTELTGLADGIYKIWGFYWDQVTSPANDWVLSAGLSSGSLKNYSSPDQPVVNAATTERVTNAASLSFTTAVDVTVTDDIRNLFGVDLGQVEVSGGSVVKVYVGNKITTGTGNRAWYDGVGYQLLGSTEPGDTFADWISDFPDVGAEVGLDQDPDGDGSDNGVENFFGTDPSVCSQGLVSAAVNVGAGTFTFTHPISDTPASDLTATYRWSKELSTFTPDGGSFEGTTVVFSQGTPSSGFVTVTATITGTSLSELFVDVEVTQD